MHTGIAKRVMIFIDETDRFHGSNLGSAIVERVRKEGCAGATVLRGSLGFGVHGQVHTTAIVDLSINLPVVIIVVDDVDKIDALLPILQEMVTEGLILVDEVQAIRKNGSRTAPDAQVRQASGAQHKVAEYMDDAALAVSPKTSVEEIVRRLIENHRAHLPVVNEDGVLLGMISSQDLLARIVHVRQGPFRFFSLAGEEKHAARKDIKTLTASEVMSTHVPAVESDTPMVKAVQIMLHDKISALPVVADHKLVGILSLPEVLQKALSIEIS